MTIKQLTDKWARSLGYVKGQHGYFMVKAAIEEAYKEGQLAVVKTTRTKAHAKR